MKQVTKNLSHSKIWIQGVDQPQANIVNPQPSRRELTYDMLRF